jgi:hypothetical protein
MFRLHDKTRRIICFIGFILLCIVTTLGTAVWCIERNLPWVAGDEARNIARQLGLEVRITGLENVRPGVVRYKGFELVDPETGQCLLRSRLLEAQCKTINDDKGNRKPMLFLMASQPEIEAPGIQQLGRLLQRTMHGQTGHSAIDIRLTARDLTLRAGANPQTLSGVEGILEYRPEGVHSAVAFQLAGVDNPEPVVIHVYRNKQTTPPTSSFEFQTGSNELPCDLLALGIADFGNLGSRSRFRGKIVGIQDPSFLAKDNWSGSISDAQLLGVDLDLLVSNHFPHKLSGTANVAVNSAQFNHGKLEDASGEIVVEQGVISPSLLQSAVKYMKFGTLVDLDLRSDPVRFDRLALRLSINGRGLWIEGRCFSSPRNIVMTYQREALLIAPASQPLPVTALIQTLVPESTVQVPATSQTGWLYTHLPMPQVVTPQTREAILTTPNLRLGQH